MCSVCIAREITSHLAFSAYAKHLHCTGAVDFSQNLLHWLIVCHPFLNFRKYLTHNSINTKLITLFETIFWNWNYLTFGDSGSRNFGPAQL